MNFGQCGSQMGNANLPSRYLPTTQVPNYYLGTYLLPRYLPTTQVPTCGSELKSNGFRGFTLSEKSTKYFNWAKRYATRYVKCFIWPIYTTNFSIEKQHSMLNVTSLVLTNQSALFQSREQPITIVYAIYSCLGPIFSGNSMLCFLSILIG